MKGLLLAAIIVFTSLALQKVAAMSGNKYPELIPREVLFGNPSYVSAQVSPDSSKLAYLAPSNGVLNVWIRTVGLKDDKPVTSDTDRGIRSYFWSGDGRRILYLQDAGGNENWRLFGVELQSGKLMDYTPFENVQVRLIKREKSIPDKLLISINRRDPKLHDAYLLDVNSGELTLLESNPGNVTEWVGDSKLQPRAAVGSLPDGGSELIIKGKAGWKRVLKWDFEDSSNSGPVGFNKNGTSIYLLDSQGRNSSALFERQLESGQTREVCSDTVYDVDDVLMDPDDYSIQAVSFIKERKAWVIIDPGIKKDFARLAGIKKGDFSIVSRDAGNSNWVVAFMVDDGPVSYYLYDRKTGGNVFLFDHKPELKNLKLAKMQPISFKTRDGLVVHGYISFPPGALRRGLPCVLNVHGGPWVRDNWGYDPEAQWLTNRGYICLQVNYRGSSGYGKDFLNAGNRQWGAKMHDDLLDAVDFVVQKGWADSKRIAIYGGSYGGYAALAGAAFTPEVFACAIDLVGPSNLISFINSIPPYWTNFLHVLHKRVGDPEKDKEFLQSRSPLFKAGAINIPVLIAQGANDPRVNMRESEQIVNALRSKGLECQYMLFPDEGHGFAKPANRIKFYAAAEEFLSRHMGGRFQK